ERFVRSMSRYHYKYRFVLAAVVVVSLVLPAPLFAQPAPASSPSTTAPQTPSTSDGTPAIQPPAASTEIALKLPRDLSPWGMFLAADIVVKSVMVGLAFASVLTWTIWFAKAMELMIARRRMRATIEALNQVRSWSEAIGCMKGSDNKPAPLLHAAEVELRLS